MRASHSARGLHNVPAELTSFVGRRRELAEIKQRLGTSRLVTLTGPGGVGKTRLALRAAEDLRRAVRDGVWFVDLAGLGDAHLVGKAVMTGLGLRDQSGQWPTSLLIGHLAPREALLLYDNCEHLLDAVAVLSNVILREAPGVRILATSRQPLGIVGERVINVAPLALPTTDDARSAQRLAQSEAVSLLLERAAAAGVEVDLSSVNQQWVIEVCRRLDGMPLALELAAVRLRTLGLQQLLERLVDRFALLTGGSRAALPRQQTLRATIDWSYDLLTEPERAVLRRLGAFAGAFGLDAAESVCASADVAQPAILDLLSALVEKSFVTRVGSSDAARYRLHETMREYAILRLREAGEEDAGSDSLVRFYAGMCRQARDGAESLRLARWLDWADREADNIRAALQDCLRAGRYPQGISMAGSLSWYWATRAVSEGVHWLDQFLAHPEGDPGLLAQALFSRGFLAMLQVDLVTAGEALAAADRQARDVGESGMLARIVAVSGIVRLMQGDLDGARSRIADAGTLARELNDPDAIAAAELAIGMSALAEGQVERAYQVFSGAARVCRERGDLYMLDYNLMNVGFTSLLGDRPDEAKAPLEEALQIARSLDDRTAVSNVFLGLSCQAAAVRHEERAARLMGAAENLRMETGVQMNPLGTALATKARETAVETLGAAKFEAELDAGRRMSRTAALAYALGESPQQSSDVASVDGAGIRLTGREQEIAALVAGGLTNKQIAARLVISERTAENHILNILNKLGFNARTQIASWATAHQLGAHESSRPSRLVPR